VVSKITQNAAFREDDRCAGETFPARNSDLYYGGVLLVKVKNIRPEAFQAKISVENIDRITNVVGQNLSNQR
jgi:hypothetical protein